MNFDRDTEGLTVYSTADIWDSWLCYVIIVFVKQERAKIRSTLHQSELLLWTQA